MDVIRRNTDYALRLVVGLVENYGKAPVSARQLAKNQDVSYELACKLLQKLSSAKLVKSSMGAAGGFELAKRPEKSVSIRLLKPFKAVSASTAVCRTPKAVPDDAGAE